jgi:hypothetical protein
MIHLGLQLSDDGNWNKHINMITKKAFSRVNILRKFKFILDRKTLETSVCAVSCGSSTIKYGLVSSANNFIVELISVSMSFMKTMKKRGCRIDPWGTPAWTKVRK